MIPVSLTLKGIYSYQKAEIIDFTRLTEGQLFGIFGSVGSGKSTILEAISFALYGETERLNKTDGRNYNMMNLKSDELLIDFIFRNFEDQEYRFIVKGRRNGRQFDKVSTLERTAFKKVKASWESISVTSAESLLGNLSYDNFRRTIIIPQGKFQEFLQLTDGDRTKMLKEIFNLNKFEFTFQTSHLIRKNDENIQHLKGRLVRHETISQEVLEEKLKLISRLSVELKALTEKYQLLQKTEKEEQELKKISEELIIKQKELQELEEQKDSFAVLDKRLQDYEYCLQKFSNKIERLKDLRKEVSDKKILLEKKNLREEKLKTEYTFREEEFNRISKEYDQIQTIKNEWEDCERLIKILDLNDKIGHLQKRISNGKVKLDQSQKEKSDLEHEIKSLKAKIKESRTSIPDLTVLTQIKSWFSEKKHLVENIQKRKSELNDIKEEIKNNKEAFLKQIPDFVSKDKTSPDSVIDFLNIFLSDNEKKIDKLNEKISGYLLQEKLKEYAHNLHDGEPCPLCGSLEHPEVLNVGSVRNYIEEANHEIQQIKESTQAAKSTLQQLDRLLINFENLKKQENLFEAKIDTEEKILKAHLDNFCWKEFDSNNEKKVIEQIEKAGILSNEVEKQEELCEEKESKLQELLENFEKWRFAIENFERDTAAREAELKTLSEQLKILKPEQEKSSSWYEDHAKKLQKQIISTEKSHKELSDLIQNLKQEIATLQGQTGEINDAINRYTQDITLSENDLESCLQQSDYSSFSDIEKILSSNLNLSEEREKVNKFRQKLYQTAEEIKRLETLTGNRVFDNEKYTLLVTELDETHQKQQQTNDTLVEERALAEQIEKDIKEKLEIEKELKKLEQRAENLKTLSNMFRGSGFVEFISGVFLQDLCRAANERFYRLTRQQLRLEINEKNNFQVRDFLNDGRVRSVKTLSGGQTFQASLSLALALAERIQQQNKARQNFFFLDEGFGSQDKQSLQIVFDTLKSLRKENRIVGIISHVEELQQEIEVFLKIQNNPETGSRISKSWENNA